MLQLRISQLGTLIGLIVVLTIVPLQLVSAHAYVQQTTPAMQANVEESPTKVSVQFDEAIQNQAPTIAVTDEAGNRVDKGAAFIEQESNRIVSVKLTDALSKGIYSVSWRVISADGHAVSGTFMFGYQATAAIPDATSDQSNTPIMQSLVKWPLYIGLSMIAGVQLALLYLIPTASKQALKSALKTLVMTGMMLVILAFILQFIAQTALLNNVSLWQALDFKLAWQTLTETTFGQLWFWRCCAVMVFAVSGHFYFNHSTDKWALKLSVMTVGFIGMTLATAASGHSQAATIVVLSTVTDWLHLTAASVWIGGVMIILTLYLTLRREQSTTVKLAYDTSLQRFAPVAFGAVLTLIMSGILLSALYFSSIMQVFTSTYGRTLLIKVLVVFIMGVIGIGHFVARTMKRTKVPNKGTLWAEIGAGIIILGLVGFLTNTATPPPPEPEPLVLKSTLKQHQINLTISPAIVGENVFDVQLDQADVKADWQQVQMIVAKNRSEVSTTTTLDWDEDAQRYRAKGLFISQTGKWQVTIKALSTDFETIEDTFEIRISR